MFTKTTFALAFVLASAAGALATTNTHSIAPSHDGYTVYSPAGAQKSSDIGFVVWASIVLIGLAILSIALGVAPAADPAIFVTP
jgi:hypothetical protein